MCRLIGVQRSKQRIRRARIRIPKCISQTELVRRLGVSKQVISRHEEIRQVGVTKVQEILDAIGIKTLVTLDGPTATHNATAGLNFGWRIAVLWCMLWGDPPPRHFACLSREAHRMNA